MTNLEKKLLDLGYEDKTPFVGIDEKVYLRKEGEGPMIVVDAKAQSIEISLWKNWVDRVAIGIPVRGERLVKGDDFNKFEEAMRKADKYKSHVGDAQETYLKLLSIENPWEEAK